MTRDEFMDIANKEIDQMLVTQKNRMLGLVERAWAEGKKNAEVSGIEVIVKEAIEKIYDKPETKEQLTITTPGINFDHLLDWSNASPSVIDGIPNECRTCSNHPSNGGSGICYCIIGVPPITC